MDPSRTRPARPLAGVDPREARRRPALLVGLVLCLAACAGPRADGAGSSGAASSGAASSGAASSAAASSGAASSGAASSGAASSGAGSEHAGPGEPGRDVEAWLAEARPALEAGAVRDALPALDEAARLAPKDPRVQLPRARGLLQVGLEDGSPLLFLDALEAFLEVSEAAPQAWLGASRAARLLHYDSGDPARLDEAIEYARRGIAALDRGEFAREDLTPQEDPERLLAEASVDRWRVAAEAGEADVEQRAAAARAALDEWIGHAPDAPEPWLARARFEEARVGPAAAREVLLRALAIRPGSEPLHAELVRVARGLGGTEEVVRLYERWTAEHPDEPLGWWFLAQDRFEGAIDRLPAGEEAEEAFARAEEEFARCAELEPAYAEACTGRRILCRTGRGTARLEAGDLEAARELLESTTELSPDGLLWEYPGRMYSALHQLSVLLGKWSAFIEAQPPIEERRHALAEAVEVAERVYAQTPEDGTAANNVGFFRRDAGVLDESFGSRLLEIAHGLRTPQAGEAPDEQARARLREEGEALIASARSHMERSWEAYRRAAELLPEDARVVNDAGLILTYYLQREPEVAQRLHEQAIEVGRRQLSSGEAAPTSDVRVAVADAYQNLGYLELTLLGNPAAALQRFEQAIEFEPATRPELGDGLLAVARAAVRGLVDPEDARLQARWGVTDRASLAARLQAGERIRAALERLAAERDPTPSER